MSHGIHPPRGEPPLHSSPVLDFPTLNIEEDVAVSCAGLSMSALAAQRSCATSACPERDAKKRKCCTIGPKLVNVSSCLTKDLHAIDFQARRAIFVEHTRTRHSYELLIMSVNRADQATTSAKPSPSHRCMCVWPPSALIISVRLPNTSHA